ncbi:MAG: YneF family protein [Bacilli bacterium]|nr:YneF family protein [Bacilli bacterium]
MLQDILLILLGLIIGLITGFFLAKHMMKKYMTENPPINEKMIETLMSGMGRKPSQKQINQMMRDINRLQK